jgi:hypothetical protein
MLGFQLGVAENDFPFELVPGTFFGECNIVERWRTVMLYYFDETADQGYIDKASTLDEYGILAGWAFPDRNKEAFESKLSVILSCLPSCDFKKLHCTELFKDDANNSLRDDLYGFLINLTEYVIIHEGAYSLGVKQQEQAGKKICKAHPFMVPDHIRVKEPQKRTRLYTELLPGIIVKLEQCAIRERESQVYMISDKLDKAMQNEADEQLKYLRSSKHVKVAKAYDTNAQRPLTQTIEIETTSPDINTKIERVKSISYVDEVTPLTFVADFICFELLRHFRRRMKIERPIKFQSPKALEGFPLKDKIVFLNSDDFTDHIFSPMVDV